MSQKKPYQGASVGPEGDKKQGTFIGLANVRKT